MKSLVHIVFFMVISSTLHADCAIAQETRDSLAQALLKRMDDARFPGAYDMTIRMTTVRPGRDILRYEYEIVGVGEDKSRMTVTAPSREVGKQILLNGDNLWFYVPDVSRPVKLTRKASFMGSTFSNEDVMNSTLADDYAAELISTDRTHEQTIFHISLSALKKSVAYAGMTAGVDSATAIPDTVVYYGLSGKALKQMISLETKLLAGKIRPSKMRMEDFLEENAFTEVEILTLERRAEIPESVFDPTRLGK